MFYGFVSKRAEVEQRPISLPRPIRRLATHLVNGVVNLGHRLGVESDAESQLRDMTTVLAADKYYREHDSSGPPTFC